MTPEEFRRHGHAVIDWLADYMARVETLPVLSRVEPGAVRAALPPAPPEHGESFADCLADVERIVVPGLTHWQHPRFLAYFPANASGPSILGELLSAGLGVQGMLWATSPACTELETHVMDWLADMLGLPAQFRSSSTGGGVIQDTASSSALVAMLAARERATGGAANAEGARQPLVAYTSTEAHSSILKGVRIAGIGERNLRLVPTTSDRAMDAEALGRMIEADRAAGLLPFFVSATIGTTSTGAIDPVPAIAALGRRHGLWVHVDAAHAGPAALVPELRWTHDGLDTVDSYCFNPHKWMLTNFDCDCFWVADRAALIGALSVLPEYLRNRATESGAVIDYRDWQVQLGRRFRALKLWLVIRHYGVEGLRAHVRHHVALTRWLTAAIDADPDFERVGAAPLTLVCFRLRGDDDRNQALLDAVNEGGETYITHTRVDGRLVLRIAVGATSTEHRHVEQAWEVIRTRARALGAA
ncbi:MAG: aminotransferase class V-fold PLP-dependent enzyme [Ectothiorhodospiraceae bacterium]|nr:aminotransferase class V-fold PLP-dependent enzyme [Chromatiales bacterium]MCP5155434.1 aminotransferase class V-fold PLP-dependent enzyme [Ectothiorhodospiraceae bacterium]